MKIHILTTITFLFFIAYSCFGQHNDTHSVYLKTGTFYPASNINQHTIDSINLHGQKWQDKIFIYIQFLKTPGAGERKLLSASGIELLNYLPHYTYLASVHNRLSVQVLKRSNAISIFQLSPSQKLHPALASGFIPQWAQKQPGTIELLASFPKSLTLEEIQQLLKQKNIEIIDQQFSRYHVIGFRIAKDRLLEIASFSFLEYIEPIPHPDQPLNFSSQAYSAARALSAGSGVGGKDLDGEGVVVGVGDNANIISHIDFSNRVIDRSAVATNESHGKHVTGTVAGGGIREEKNKGFAPGATIISQTFSRIITNAPAYVNDHNMVVTNNSYGAVNNNCEYAGYYDLISYIMDQQAFDMPNLQHVFAAGNDGSVNCSPYPIGFQTVLGSFQSAKNVITVGGMNYSNSSKGPVKDGRVKPEITAQGSGIVSTGNNNGYFSSTGTSNSTPAVSGGLALLYQQYREQNGNLDPKSGLMKALICNGAADIGNPGPDFRNGYGLMNLRRSSEMLENEHYFSASISQGTNNIHTISGVPSGTAQIKVMLYWHDPSASGLSAKTLVNDLDLELTTPSSSIVLPGILNPSPANVQNNSVTGIDQLNNMEQVVINNPEAGDYSVMVKGTAINQNPQQEYFLVYDIIPAGIELTHPIGGETLIPAETILLTWEDASIVSNSFTIEISTDNGSNWTSFQSAAGVRFYNWAVPNITTNQALVRITNNGTGAQSVSQPFTILGRPTVSLAAVQCEGYINLTWTPVTGATQYEVMRLFGKKMVSVFLTPDATTLQYALGGLAKDSVYWVSVRAINNGISGRRALAVSRMPATGTCSGTLSDYDLKIDSILSPRTGRTLTSTALTSSEDLIIRVKNLDDAAATNFTVSFTINGLPGSVQNITNPLAAGANLDVIFPGVDLSSIGSYSIQAEVVNNAYPDPVIMNNQLTVMVNHLPNEALDLTNVFKDDVEAAEQESYINDRIGLKGADRYDFKTTHQNNGRLRTFFSSGISYSGSNAFTLDASNYTNPAVTNFLTGTYNLVNYDATIDDVRLDFQFKHHSQYANINNRIWIRGNDNPITPWIEVYDLSLNQASAGVYKRSASLELGDLLAANGQNFSTSFQARWGQEGVVMASDNTWGNGYSFDDIKLYKAIDDIQLLSIDEPAQVDCGLGAAAQVTVTIRNSANQTINNVPIRLNVNNGVTITEIIPVVNGNETLSYSFTTPVNLSAFGNHEIVSWVDLDSDNFRNNDTARLQLTNSPIISDFPYLENFETSAGYWYASGINSSWAYGIPVSPVINQAASGTKVWKTNLNGNYNNDENSYLYSPCFDITGLSNPTLSFSLALDIEDCGSSLCDAIFVEYSIDGNSWMRLGDATSGVNWYNKNYAGNTVWSVENYTRWHVVTVSLPTDIPALRIRIVLRSDPGVTREGIAIDDIHIYDNSFGIYDGITMNAPVTQPVSGTDWVHFTENGKLIASILPVGQDLGNTSVQTYINDGAVRFMSGQYYHNRNITIKPENTIIAQPVRVRFYFLDDETENLINASGCGTCSKPVSGYGLGVSKYTHTTKNLENGTTADNNGGEWLFIIPEEVDKIPFDKGYYAEFEVQNFSEFWLNDGGPEGTTPLPVKLLSFTAKKQNGNDVSLQWITATENELDRFEIELAKGNNSFQLNHFENIGFVAATGNSNQQINYEHIDREPGKNTPRFYRLKMVDRDGRYVYSPVRSVVYGISQNWKVLPNPSNGEFNLIFQANEGSKLKIQLSDASGRILKNWEPVATGFEQKFSINLIENIYPGGVYMIRVEADNQQKVFRLIKK
jgi:hypothetical protein